MDRPHPAAPAAGTDEAGAVGRRPGARADFVWAAALAGTVLLTLIGPLLADRPGRTVAAPFARPTSTLPLGADYLGRSVSDRALAGGADLLLVAGGATLAATAVGVALGLFTALPGRGSRWTSAGLLILLVMPPVLVMMVVAFGLGPGAATMVLLTVCVSAPLSARYLRAVVRPILDSGYVEMARAAGDSTALILVREVLPNLAGPVLADLGSRFVGAFYLVSAAGFLGLSALAGGGDWAAMIRQNLPGITINPWATVVPAMAIAAVTIPANLLADRCLHRWTR